jgi:hypothetical protein
MKKQFFILLVFIGISQLGAETLVQIYPPSGFEFISGKNAVLYRFERNEDDPIPAIFNLPVEVRQTVKKFSFADLMVAGGISLFFEDKALSSLNFSGGLTFGYGYNIEHILWIYFYEKNPFFAPINITLYPLYEFPFAIFPWKTAIFPWKFAVDITVELFQLKHLSINSYGRIIGLYGKNKVAFGLPDVGLTVGVVF